MINIETKILETLGKMPISLQEELLHYAEYLQEKYSENNVNINTSNQKRRSGILEGTFVLPLPDDFDESLEDFEKYMR
ncbi:DUF2281 domain-containing protein [Cyanobacterium aponinum UTEX 3222]|uniref:DUF2281 domain-containing protein n=1 Tax=Cyanobacterium aponinum AL20115 TaxID=3090662 RepID=A0AAF0ZFU4_9CHRO|nr:DUF2281 domain-containing protein [Cyanobacterium aponinum]WPF89367.1 DUF2281 domain-containing protein [Cyanobacterium aponinum AL20115]WRL38402.1 DUF2281 domain-containing protein [Cyanobacterium aponinum UTEX 3221]WRL41995.1 DUF2281 domain-containing protein [Cyanobacterium aponinum UTEX 3222]